jgi:hypothetical protein
MSIECQLEQNKAKCTCSDTSCKRHGACCQCVAYHREAKNLPMCLRNQSQ